jgi:hypothetical protein
MPLTQIRPTGGDADAAGPCTPLRRLIGRQRRNGASTPAASCRKDLGVVPVAARDSLLGLQLSKVVGLLDYGALRTHRKAKLECHERTEQYRKQSAYLGPGLHLARRWR